MSTDVLQGSLAAFKLPEVLTFLAGARKSGTLALHSGNKDSSVFFRDGALVFASSTDEQLRLGAILLRKKRLTRAECDLIDELMRREGGRFGEIAIKEGILGEAQLRDFLKVQVSEILYDAFVWSGGTFAFGETLDLPAYAVTISVDLANLIMEGARRIEEWEQCVRLLPDKTIVFHVVPRPTEEKITLTADEWRILFLINGQRTLDELCHAADDDRLEIYRVVYGLLSNHLIEPAVRTVTMHGEQTMRQAEVPRFGSESTIRDQEGDDDTSLLISEEAKLSYHDVVKPVVAQLRAATDGTTIPIVEAEYLVGRHSDNGIRLNDPGVSSFHARIFRGPDGYVIEDLKSRNGVWLNGSRVFHAVLKNGDKVRLGANDYLYEVLFT
ncbi:MAG TPA: DUF4388 domain-containing protein [Thermoanaerobaculia bacterium]|jgi:hypothetical protein